MSYLKTFVVLPLRDTFRGLEHCVARHGFLGLVYALMGLAVGFWLYVPIHELLHVAGCVGTGGTVSRLEVQEIFGGGLLAQIFPWVVPGGEYAGRLAEFDTGGSDWVYLATDLAPFLLTLFPGVWLLRWGAETARSLVYGLALPVALAPLMSLTGDAYEIGSILTTQVGSWASLETSGLLRGDDVLKTIETFGTLPAAPWGGLIVAILLGTFWALATYAVGGWIATRLGRPPVSQVPAPPKKGDQPKSAEA